MTILDVIAWSVLLTTYIVGWIAALHNPHADITILEYLIGVVILHIMLAAGGGVFAAVLWAVFHLLGG